MNPYANLPLGTVHDFFKPQPVKNASMYFVRFVMHDWSDEWCKKLLSQLRAAAGPTSKLIMFEEILRHVCPESGPFAQQPAPYPLLANYGAGMGAFQSAVDIQVRTRSIITVVHVLC